MIALYGLEPISGILSPLPIAAARLSNSLAMFFRLEVAKFTSNLNFVLLAFVVTIFGE
jgi:hypothetical protein